jgi:hypothetical protein
MNSTDPPSQRQPLPAPPEVVASFTEPHENAGPLLLALGRAILAANVLEIGLLAVIAALRGGQEGLSPQLDDDLAELAGRSAGHRHGALRDLGLPGELDQRIDDAIKRRNRLVHHTVEDPVMLKAVVSDEGLDAAVEQVERLALDCGRLARELFLAANPWLEAMMGDSWSVIDLAASIDLDGVTDPSQRKLLEAVRAMRDFDLSDPDLPR